VRDPYAVLGVHRGASEAEIKAAFRRLAAQHHPDRNPDDPEATARFKEANLAYQTLSDPHRRAAYDRYGAAAFDRTGGSSRPGPGFVDLGNLDGVWGDLLDAIGIRPGDRGHLRKKVKLTFEEAALGCQKPLSYERVDLCGQCHGQAAQPGTPLVVCPTCGGRGRQPMVSGLLSFALDKACPRCRGTGKAPTTPCTHCKGTGLAQRLHEIMVEIPPGIEHGSNRVVEHAGHRTRPSRAAGNLEVTVEVDSHPYFRRVNDDVVSSVSIAFTQATLGGEIDVATLDGMARLRVPPATQPGTMLRLRGKGVPHRLRGGRGDHLVEVTIEVPRRLSSRAQALIEQLGQELGEEVHPQERSLLERLRAWLG
jgi:molecular chaperone DnaJ